MDYLQGSAHGALLLRYGLVVGSQGRIGRSLDAGAVFRFLAICLSYVCIIRYTLSLYRVLIYPTPPIPVLVFALWLANIYGDRIRLTCPSDLSTGLP